MAGTGKAHMSGGDDVVLALRPHDDPGAARHGRVERRDLGRVAGVGGAKDRPGDRPEATTTAAVSTSRPSAIRILWPAVPRRAPTSSAALSRRTCATTRGLPRRSGPRPVR